MCRNVQGSIAWPVASTKVNIAVFEEEPSAPVRIFMRRTLGYARPQDRLDCERHHHGRKLCSVQLIELVVMTQQRIEKYWPVWSCLYAQFKALIGRLLRYRVRAGDSTRRCARLQRWIRRRIRRVAPPNAR
jgi:hypothetical protein